MNISTISTLPRMLGNTEVRHRFLTSLKLFLLVAGGGMAQDVETAAKKRDLFDEQRLQRLQR